MDRTCDGLWCPSSCRWLSLNEVLWHASLPDPSWAGVCLNCSSTAGTFVASLAEQDGIAGGAGLGQHVVLCHVSHAGSGYSKIHACHVAAFLPCRRPVGCAPELCAVLHFCAVSGLDVC